MRRFYSKERHEAERRKRRAQAGTTKAKQDAARADHERMKPAAAPMLQKKKNTD